MAPVSVRSHLYFSTHLWGNSSESPLLSVPSGFTPFPSALAGGPMSLAQLVSAPYSTPISSRLSEKSWFNLGTNPLAAAVPPPWRPRWKQRPQRKQGPRQQCGRWHNGTMTTTATAAAEALPMQSEERPSSPRHNFASSTCGDCLWFPDFFGLIR